MMAKTYAAPAGCSCRPIRLNGGFLSGQEVGRSWQPDCPEHGLLSEWWATTGRAANRKRSDVAVIRQALAALARRTDGVLAQAAGAALDRLAGGA